MRGDVVSLCAELDAPTKALDAARVTDLEQALDSPITGIVNCAGSICCHSASLVKCAGFNRMASTALPALGRIGRPEDVASGIAWLLDPANSWVTGQVLGIDGGLGTLRPR